MIFHACAVFLPRCGVRFRLRTIEYAALSLPCLVAKILAHPPENHFVRGYMFRNIKVGITAGGTENTISPHISNTREDYGNR